MAANSDLEKNNDLYQKREKIQAKAVKGPYQTIRIVTMWITLSVYFLLPWMTWNGRQAILFDLPQRKFYILGLTFWPQDFVLLSWLLIILAFTLLFVTNLAGRIWCGYYCPQTAWTKIYMWIEQLCEGSRTQRMRLDKSPWSLEKARKRLFKHGLWLVIAFITAFTGIIPPPE